MTRVQTFGPREVDEDCQLGDGRVVRVLHYEYYAEAVGSDGRSYYAAGRGQPTPFVEEQERLRAATGEILETRMREEGVWEE